jgi:hypothetical protein
MSDDLTTESILGPRFAGRRFLRVADLIELGIVDNRSTLEYWVDKGWLPRPMRVGARVLIFPVTEVVEVLTRRARDRDRLHDHATRVHDGGTPPPQTFD